MPMHAQPSTNTNSGLVEQTREAVADTAQATATTIHDTVDHYPISSALVVFGVGLGAGVLIGAALADPAVSSFSASRRGGSTAEAFGQRVMDGIASVMPDALANHFNR